MDCSVNVPVRTKGKFTQKIYDTELEGEAWQNDHWEAFVKTIKIKAFRILEILKPFYKKINIKCLVI